MKYFIVIILFFLYACGETDQSENKTIKDISAFNTIAYLNAHPILDTSAVQILQNYPSIIQAKKEEQRLLTAWLANFDDGKQKDILQVWEKFGNILDLITLEFKVIQLMGYNPRVFFLRKEAFYRELGIPFKPFANGPVFMILQNQLLFARDLLQNYPQDSTQVLLDHFFEKHRGFNKADREALRFDLMRWYILKENGVISGSK